MCKVSAATAPSSPAELAYCAPLDGVFSAYVSCVQLYNTPNLGMVRACAGMSGVGRPLVWALYDVRLTGSLREAAHLVVRALRGSGVTVYFDRSPDLLAALEDV